MVINGVDMNYIGVSSIWANDLGAYSNYIQHEQHN